MKFSLGLVILAFCIKQSFSVTAFSSAATDCIYCNSNADCTPVDDYKKCTCKATYVGNGFNCTPMVYCNETCCPPGYTWRKQSKTCVDINECEANTHICATSRNCFNRNGIYLCTYNANVACPTLPCAAGLDCVSNNGISQCVDPCSSYTTLNATNRLYTINTIGIIQTDRYNYGWFKYTDGFRMRELSAGYWKCGSLEPFSLGVLHTSISQNITTVPLLVNSKTPTQGPNIQAKECNGYYVYKFTGSLQTSVFCTEPVPVITTTTTTTTTTLPTPTTDTSSSTIATILPTRATTPTSYIPITTPTSSPTSHVTQAGSSDEISATVIETTTATPILPTAPPTLMPLPTILTSSTTAISYYDIETPTPTTNTPNIDITTEYSEADTPNSAMKTTNLEPGTAPVPGTDISTGETPISPQNSTPNSAMKTTNLEPGTAPVPGTEISPGETPISPQRSTPNSAMKTTNLEPGTAPVPGTNISPGETPILPKISTPNSAMKTTNLEPGTAPVPGTDISTGETPISPQNSTPNSAMKTTNLKPGTAPVPGTYISPGETPILPKISTILEPGITSVTDIDTNPPEETTISPQRSTPNSDINTAPTSPDTPIKPDTTHSTDTHTVPPPTVPQNIKLTISIFSNSELTNLLYIPLYNSSSNTPLHVVLEAEDDQSRKHVILVNTWFVFRNDKSEDQTFFNNYKPKSHLLKNEECYQEVSPPVRAFTKSNNDRACQTKCEDCNQQIVR